MSHLKHTPVIALAAAAALAGCGESEGGPEGTSALQGDFTLATTPAQRPFALAAIDMFHTDYPDVVVRIRTGKRCPPRAEVAICGSDAAVARARSRLEVAAFVEFVRENGATVAEAAGR